MIWFEQLETHLSDLYHNRFSRVVDAFKPAFLAFFGAGHQTFKLKMFHNLDQLKLQFERENLHEVHAKTCLEVLRLQFKEFFASPALNSLDHLSQCWQDDFNMYMYCDPETYTRDLLNYLDIIVDLLHQSVLHYVNYGCMKSKDVKINPVQAVNADLVVTESGGTNSDKQDTSSNLGNYLTHVVGADIRLVNDQVPFAEIKSVKEASNEAKVKNDIDVIETINIELEHKVAKLLKENDTLKKHYKDLYDSIKVKRTKTIEQITSLIDKNDEFKAQL
ncbi:hypothetical protein Tco_0385494 [Tanacetum coccineum]